MAATKPDILLEVTGSHSLANVAIGSQFSTQNKSNVWVILQENSSRPSPNNNSGIFITDLRSSEPSKMITSGSLEIWAKSEEIATLYVQTI